MAPSEEILEAFVRKLDEIIVSEQKAVDSGRAPESSDRDEQFEDGYPHSELTDFPLGGSSLQIVLFAILFPLRLIMHWTIPDVRRLDQAGNPVSSLSTAFAASVSCLVWLIVGSYAMVASLERLADLLDIPDAVVGATVSAAGTSLPNYVASSVAARNGFGNMAVSNAFGSNTFNIMVGLGLPWLLYTGFGTHFEAYHSLRDEGITQSVLILFTVLLVFVVLVIPNDFTLYRWHGVLFIALYVLYLLFVVGQVYW